MIVQHNITAMNSNRMLGLTTSAQAKSTEKLSSGYKINRAADDAAGLAISEKMRRQVRGLTQASANAQDGISAVQTAEGALTEVHDMLQRINELSVKGENGTMTTTDRAYIQREVAQLMSEIDRVQSTTTFNEMNLLDGTFTGKGLQVGAEAGQHIDIDIEDMSMQGLADKIDTKLYTDVSYSPLNAKGEVQAAKTIDTATATDLIETFTGLEAGDSTTVATQQDFNSLNAFAKAALALVSQQRSDLGAVQNRLEHTINNLDNVVENTTSAEAAIRDTDIATEMVKYANNNILQQAGTSMLSQANQSNQLALSLLG
ncbi:MAG: flagellin [Lachnospiraceae bacterium]|nr:flagellin [Lachnospiraceae bacterium]MDE6387301.1 flagellin [Lachnospiraceae bacterium]